MFIDYLTIMLANMAAALFLFALYVVFFFEKDPKKAVPGFLLTGGLALITGLAMTLTWPLPGSANILFGEPTALLGAVFFMAGLSLHFGWNLLTVGVFALGSGAAAILLGFRILDMNLTKEPAVAAVGYFLAGLVGVLTLPVVALPKWKWVRWVAAIIAVLGAALWIFMAFTSYWGHIQAFAKWAPSTMPPAPPKQ